MRKSKNWIQEGKDKGTIREGGLHKSLGIPQDKKIPMKKINKATHSNSPLIRKQADLAKVFKKIHKGK